MPNRKINFCSKFAIKLFANADNGSLKSLHTIFDTYLDYMLLNFEQNRMVQNIQNFEPFDKNKTDILQSFLTKRWRHILENVSVAEPIIVECWTINMINLKTIIFQCSKNYYNPPRVTRLKVASNMPDSISIKHSESSLKSTETELKILFVGFCRL